MGPPPSAWSGAGGWRPLMELIGREADVVAIERELEGRLVTVVGAGGIGKSVVAQHVLERSRTSAETSTVWVDLGWMSSVDEMAIAWSRALGTAVESHASLIDAIEIRGPVLLVIDNCEHVTRLIAPIVEEIVGTCDRARLLATSRDSLGIAGERLWRLSGLPYPPADTELSEPDAFAAVQLFLNRAMQVRPTIDVDESALAEIGATCRMLDGNPLGIILAAGHLRAMSAADLRASVQDSNALISSRSAVTDPRHASIDASLRWSVDLLEPVDRDVLAALGAFPGGFDLDTARMVGGSARDAGDVMTTIGRLVDHGLVDFDGEHTYHLPFVVRRFALDAGERNGRLPAALERHARQVLGWAAGVTAWGDTVDPALIDRRAVDIHAGLKWAMEHDAHLADQSFASFGVMLHGTIRRQYCDWVAARTDRDLDWARAVGWLAILAPVDAAPMLDDSLRAAARIADEARDAHVKRLISCTGAHRATLLGDLQPARSLVHEARLAEDGWVVVASATTASIVAATLGCFEEVTAFCAATKWACTQGGLPYAATAAPLAEALMAHKSGHPALAASLIAEASDSAVILSVVLGVRAAMAIDEGDLAVLDMIRERLSSPSDRLGCLVRARATVGAHVVRGEYDTAIDVATEAMGGGPIEDTELSLFTAAALLRGGLGSARLLDELDRTRRTIQLIAEPCPAFEIVLGLLHAQACLVQDDIDGARLHLYPALDQARSHQQRLLTIDALETVAYLPYRRASRTSSDAMTAACADARSELGYRSMLFSPTPVLSRGALKATIGLDGAIALAMRTRGARRRPSTGLASLTPTENAVVDLVVAGKPNAEIASELVMSAATVKSHLSHTFVKLGVSNRTQLAIRIDRSRLSDHRATEETTSSQSSTP